MGRKILVTSGKGGVGKTTITAGLARALAYKNATVCVVDGDMSLNNLDLLMGVENKVVYDINDCMQGKCQIKQAIIKDKLLDNLYTMPAGKSYQTNHVVEFSDIINKLAGIFDFVLVDSPAGIDEGFKQCCKSCLEALVVVTPHISSLRDANKMLLTLAGDSTKSNIKVVVNRIRGDLVASGEMMSHSDIKKLLDCKLAGTVPENDIYNITSTFNFASKEEFVTSFEVLAENILNDRENIIDFSSKYKGFFGMIKRRFKRI